MNFAGRFKDKNPVEGWNFDNAIHYVVNEKSPEKGGEKEKTITVEFMGGKTETFKGLEAAMVFAHLAKQTILSINQEAYDWRKELKADQDRAAKEAAEHAARTDAMGHTRPKSPTSTASGL